MKCAFVAMGAENVIMMDRELQDPPELLPTLLEEWDREQDLVALF